MSTRKTELNAQSCGFLYAHFLPGGAVPHRGATQSDSGNRVVPSRLPSAQSPKSNIQKGTLSDIHFPAVRPVTASPVALKRLLRAVAIPLFLLSSCQSYPQPVFAQPETWVATAYCPCNRCCGKSDGITASGVKATEGRTVATNWLPFGTRLNINGHIYIVQDRGAVSHFGSRSHPKKRVDIFFESHGEALKFGRKQVQVEVLT